MSDVQEISVELGARSYPIRIGHGLIAQPDRWRDAIRGHHVLLISDDVEVMAKAVAVTEQKDVAYGSALLAEVGRIRADAERLQFEYESRRDLRGALRAIETRLNVIELEARFTGQIEVRQKNEFHLHFTPDRALAVAEAYVARHGSEKPLLVLEAAAPSIKPNENEEEGE